MRIRLLVPLSNAHGVFRRGQVVEWSEEDARPLLDGGAAEVVTRKAQKAAEAEELVVSEEARAAEEAKETTVLRGPVVPLGELATESEEDDKPETMSPGVDRSVPQ
jgi:hypothetical protein